MKHRSIFMLLARGTLAWLAAIGALLAAADAALYAGAAPEAPALGEAFGGQGFRLAFALALLGLTAALCANGCALGARTDYTLRRLRVRERDIFWMQAAHNALCYLILWGWQALVALALCWVYTAQHPQAVNGQSVMLACYGNAFLHSLLPLADWPLWARNLTGCAALGLCAAAFPVRQRRGRRGFAAAVLAVLAALTFPLGDVGQLQLDLISIAVAALAAFIAELGVREVCDADEA